MWPEPPETRCAASEDGEDCLCETCVNLRADAVPWDAIHIGHFASLAAFADFIESVWMRKVDADVERLPTGEAAGLSPQELALLWLRSDVVATDGLGDYFWLSLPHAAFWGGSSI